MDWINLAQDRVKWQAVANTVMNLWVFAKCRKFFDYGLINFS